MYSKKYILMTLMLLSIVVIGHLHLEGGFSMKHMINWKDDEAALIEKHPDDKEGGNTETSEMRLSRLHTMCQELRISERQDVEDALRIASSHILVDERHKTMYCFVPKAGCTSWKGLMMMMASGHNATYFADWGQKIFHNPGRHRAMNLTYLSSYGKKDRQRKLDTFFKFMFVRNPFSRLVSVYNDRFKLLPILEKTLLWQKLKEHITEDANMAFPKDGEYMSFREFATYIGAYDIDGTFNVHWHSINQWCQPCFIKYDYLGKQETMARDTINILSTIGRQDLLESVPHRNTHGKGENLWDYYKRVPTKYFKAITELFKMDMVLFGYNMPSLE